MIVEYVHYHLTHSEPEAFEAAYARAARSLDASAFRSGPGER